MSLPPSHPRRQSYLRSIDPAVEVLIQHFPLAQVLAFIEARDAVRMLPEPVRPTVPAPDTERDLCGPCLEDITTCPEI